MAATSGALASRDPAYHRRITWAILLIVLLWPMLRYSEFEPSRLLDARSLSATARFVGSFFPPALSPDFLRLVAREAWVTIAIATTGLAFGWVIAVPMTIAATASLSQSAIGRPMHPVAATVRQLLRFVLILLRSVPELVWALLFVRVVGLGPTAGVLAIALTFAGMLGKVYAEILESAPSAPTEALLRGGSSRIGALLYGAIPQSANELVSYTVYRWECAVRSSVIMGFVGGGGLGQQIDMSMKMLAGGEVLTMLVVFMLLVAAADRVSRWLRQGLETRGDE